MLNHSRSISGRVFEVWRSPERFTKNPDLARLPSGRLLLIYSDTDGHFSKESQVLTLLASDDDGRTWTKHSEVDRRDVRQGGNRLITPRLSLLSDGRLAVIVDQDNHFHEDQPPGNLVYWSYDSGDTWEGPFETGIMGFEPDHISELPDGRLAVTSHLIRGDSQMFAIILSCSDDRGKTWYQAAEIAHDGQHYFCEGALLLLADGGLACVMRDNTNNGYPSWVAFSEDGGRNWSTPQMLSFAFHRPYAKQLPDGRTLVTGRNVNGGVGTYAWCGDLRTETGYQIGGPRYDFCADLNAEALVIHNKAATECRVLLAASRKL